MKKLGFLMVGLTILLGGCGKEKYEIVEANRYFNNNLTFQILINGQNIDTVYKDSGFQVRIINNLFLANSWQTIINGQIFYDSIFNDVIKTDGSYLLTSLISNGARRFRDTAKLFVIDYPVSTIWLPGLWGDQGDSAHFRLGIDTVFFNLTFCSTRALPFVQFANNLNPYQGQIIFNDSIGIQLLSYYMNPQNTSWYFYPLKTANYWLIAPDGQNFLFLRYGGDFHNVSGTFALPGGSSYNDSLNCYIIQAEAIKWK